MSGHLICGCLALAAAHWSGVRTDMRPGVTGLGGVKGAAATLWFFIAAALMWGALR